MSLLQINSKKTNKWKVNVMKSLNAAFILHLIYARHQLIVVACASKGSLDKVSVGFCFDHCLL